MTLKTKLTGGFLIVTLIGVAIALIGYVQIHKLDAADTKMYVSIVHHADIRCGAGNLTGGP